jgi:parallel beta-helix repeat protein
VQLGYLKSAFNQAMEISWNQVINQPGQSGVEDNINIYQTQGTLTLPLRIANNFIRGGYPIDMTSPIYSGGGIITDGWAIKYGIHSPAYVTIESNQVVDTVYYGISIAAGHHNIMSNNTVVGVNRLPSGKVSPAANLGMSIWRGAKFGTSPGGPALTPEQIATNADIEANFHDNSAKSNKVGWTRYDGTVDANGNFTNPNGVNATYWFQACDPNVPECTPITDVSNNSDLGLPALSAGNAEFTKWQNKLTGAGVVIGPNWQ